MPESAHHLGRLDPEDQALIACCSAAVRPGDHAPTLGDIDPDQLDWAAFVTRARWHGLHGTVYPVVASYLRPAIDAAAWNWLRRLSGAQAAHNLRLAEALAEIDAAFRQTNIPYVVLKGLPLAQTLYGTITARRCRDIDLLVAPGHFAAARRCLEGLGYSSKHGFSEEQDEVWLRYASDLPMGNESRQVLVELHQRFEMWPDSAGERCAEGLLANAQSAPVGGFEVPATLGSALVPYLAWHGHKHAWFRLFWLLDIAALEWRTDVGDRDAIWARAGGLQQQRALGLAWWLSAALFDVPLELPQTEPDEASRVEHLGNMVLARAFGPVAPPQRHTIARRVAAMRWDWKAAVGTRERADVVWDYLFSVQPDDIRAMPLPRRLFWAYPALRPVRVVLRLLLSPLRALMSRLDRVRHWSTAPR